MPAFDCNSCGAQFEVPQAALDKYPGWVPKVCLKCRDLKRGSEQPSRAPGRGGAAGRAATPGEEAATPTNPSRIPPGPGKNRSMQAGKNRSKRVSASAEENLTTQEVLAKYTDGPDTGVFTDGAASPNPGPGGWGAVYVCGGKIVGEALGHAPNTTNNRMELTALLEGVALVPEDAAAVVYTDSQLCVNTLTKWAQGWEKNGWRRKSGEIKNLDLIRRLYALLQDRPKLQLRWVKAHSGLRWNEYADSLATAYRRETK